ncbi:hypothetical protein BDW62DRAFT_164865 [Aspergillus aurantiobrunneus]
MRLFNPVDSFDSVFSITRRQSDSSSDCGGGGVGAGECLPGSSCRGILYANQCQDSPGDECCLHRDCTTERGSGWCKNSDNQTCAGEYVAGTGPPYPCPGPNYILCCVEWQDQINSTSTTNTQTQTTLTTTSISETETESASSTPSRDTDDSGGGLSASQKGGIAGGIVGAVAVTSIIFLVFFFLRRRKRRAAQREQENAKGEKREGGDEGEDKGTETGTVAVMGTNDPEGGGGGGEIESDGAMLASREKLELDASGRALHEMDTPAAIAAKDEKGLSSEMEQVRTRRLAELPGSLAVAEMPVPENEAHERGDGVKRD